MTPTTIWKMDEWTDEELELFWVFCVIVAGKNADWAWEATNKFLSYRDEGETPMQYIERLSKEQYAYNRQGVHLLTLPGDKKRSAPAALLNALVMSGTGQYYRISHALMESTDLDLRTCTLEDLLSIYGVGNKTARFFLMYTRNDQDYAILDTHILRWLRDHGIDAPKSTPGSRKEYDDLERIYIALARQHFGREINLATIDMFIWATYSGRFDGSIEDIGSWE